MKIELPLLLLTLHFLLDGYLIYRWLKNKPERQKVDFLESQLALERVKNKKKGFENVKNKVIPDGDDDMAKYMDKLKSTNRNNKLEN